MAKGQFFEGCPDWLGWPARFRWAWWIFLPIAWVVGTLVVILLAIPLLFVAFLTRHAGEKKGIAQ